MRKTGRRPSQALAAPNGAYGLKAYHNDNHARYVRDDAPDSEARYRAASPSAPTPSAWRLAIRTSSSPGAPARGGQNTLTPSSRAGRNYIGPAARSLLGGHGLAAPARIVARPPSLLDRLLDWLRGVFSPAPPRAVNVHPPVAVSHAGPAAPLTGQTWRSYYYAGNVRVAMRVQTSTQNEVYYLHGDHLGSASLATDGNGVVVTNSRTGYSPYGGTRYGGGGLPTPYRFTGQKREAALGGPDGLYFYNARWYDPSLNRWLQPDTIVPQPSNPQSLNRYAYALGNPLKYVDPSGHAVKPPPTLGPRAEFEIFNWPSALRALYASMCVAAPNCSLEFDSANKENVLTRIQTIDSVATVWNDQQQWTESQMNSVVAMGMSADFIAPSALGRLRPPARPLLSNENVLLTEAQGLQTRTSNLFDNVILGSHGDQTTKYLWTIDSGGVNIALEQTPFPTPRGNIVHSNLSSGAYFAGEAWFTSAKEIVINAGSGRWGDRSGITQEMWQAAIKIWESLGYTVTSLPLGER